MKKKLIAFSFLSLFALASINASAQTQQPTPEKGTACCVKKDKCKKGDFSKAELKKKKHFKKGHRPNLFEGITLTSDQQTKIDKLKADRKEKHNKEKQAMAANRKMEREQFNKELASILTPEQLAQYNANRDKFKAQKKENFKGNKDGNKKFKRDKKAE